jgi:hypothetical protein
VKLMMEEGAHLGKYNELITNAFPIAALLNWPHGAFGVLGFGLVLKKYYSRETQATTYLV